MTGRTGGTRAVLLRTVWLFVGAAIGLAAVLLTLSMAAVITTATGISGPGLTVACLVPIPALGLLPGVRELETTAARSLLGVTTDLVAPARPRAEHRIRLVLLVALHLLLGLLAAALLVAGVPAAVLLAVSGGRGAPFEVAGAALPLWPTPVTVAAGLIGVGAALLGVVGLGRLSRAAVQRLLGPSAADRLTVALARLAAEAEHTRLARELHDGIGQALTVIGLQAAAGRRLLDREPRRAEDALETVEVTARTALSELDAMLGLLRREEVDPRRGPGLDQLPRLIETFRAAGLEVVCADDDVGAETDPGGPVPSPTSLPWLVSSTTYRIVAEALTNASRYAGPGPVRVKVVHDRDRLRVEVRSPLGRGAGWRRSSGGRGLVGLRERIGVLGGELDVGPAGAEWWVRAAVPLGRRRG